MAVLVFWLLLLAAGGEPFVGNRVHQHRIQRVLDFLERFLGGLFELLVFSGQHREVAVPTSRSVVSATRSRSANRPIVGV